MFDCAKGDITGETLFLGYGIFFWDMNHTINKEQNWWTFFINLLYPIIFFGILPFIVVVRKVYHFWQQKIPLKDKILTSLIYVSIILFIAFTIFYIYAWFFDPDIIGFWCFIIILFAILPAIFVFKKLRHK
jgi:hypothetical protein